MFYAYGAMRTENKNFFFFYINKINNNIKKKRKIKKKVGIKNVIKPHVTENLSNIIGRTRNGWLSFSVLWMLLLSVSCELHARLFKLLKELCERKMIRMKMIFIGNTDQDSCTTLFEFSHGYLSNGCHTNT